MLELIDEYEETKTRHELKHIHGPKGGYVLYDHEFETYKGWLQTLAAAKEFEMAFPELVKSVKYTTADFAKLYSERGALLEEIERFQPDKMLHELSDPEIKEFFEYLHAGFEMGVEDKVHALSQLGMQNYDLFEKFVKLLSANPHYFDKVTSLAQNLPHYLH